MTEFRGRTAMEIATSVRDLVASGVLAAETELPTVRSLAEQLGVNRNTVAAAYALLVKAGVAETNRRRGTRVASIPVVPREIDWAAVGEVAQRSSERSSGLVDLASGNPDPALLPDLRTAFSSGAYETVLYGDAAVDPGLRVWAREQLAPVVPQAHGYAVAHGAVDAIDRVLGAHLTRSDAVAVEDPCFLASIGVLRVNGYRIAPVDTDGDGMIAESLAAALRHGARAAVITSRALNPTGASVSAGRAAELRAVLAEYPHVLVIEDDHFSGVATTAYHQVFPPQHPRWALVRSFSKFLGPDLRLAVVAADPGTITRLETRLAAGATWVSRLLQHTACQLLSDPVVLHQLAQAAVAYRDRRGLLIDALGRRGFAVPATETDGLNVWVRLDQPAGPVIARLAGHGWAVSDGATYALTDSPLPALRVTSSALTPDQAEAFTDALVDACARP
ncbi:aminotransferase class I/II-fold pyridoxal phosphate-dependent enzyme [Amycolatopsis sp. NPDC057786]|uniref:aminotransferase class I/II-fold pyridoxal phosphate-dependent enzyme n=1 Tax=Amycolatopsis sp. NPDC057786 TaxID=3346250 RepID=UPI00366E4CD0